MDRLRLLLVASLAATSCTGANAVLLTVSADAPVEQYDLYVRDDANSQILFHSGFTAVSLSSSNPKDLRNSKLKIALKMPSKGHFTILMVGVIGEVNGSKPAPGATQLFWARRVDVEGTTDISAQLLTVTMGDDADGDLWPDATKFLADNPEAPKLYQNHQDMLDCFDDPTMTPLDSNGNPIKFKAADINPFAVEVCGDGFDENCNGNADETCVDKDKDGDPSTTDCDDNDPKRHHPTSADPFPDPPNCCGYSLGKTGTSDEGTNFLCGTNGSPPPCYAGNCNCDMTLCPSQRCGDGIDESCQGKDTTCVVDEDCDGYPAPPQGNDCDDHDPNSHPGAVEPCGSTKDLNCDGVVNGGCVPCDLDGDGYERNDSANGCPDTKDKHPGKIDCNDYDSSVYPGATTNCGGTEEGMTSIGRLTCSLMGACRRVYENTAVASPTPKISSLGWLVGDMDCNGTAYEGCPSVTCDADGDGFPAMIAGCTDPDGKYDCDDTNPTIYPGAPVSCGSGPAEDCTSQKMPCDADADGDGWNAGPDCDDTDPNVHPWAIELCDGKDNDCDGIVDEGNPDTTGKPLVASGATTTCTDSNVGVCAQTLGACVCSVASPMSTINAASRNGGKKPPHCFGAGQPHPQSCNADMPADDDCNGKVDDPTGANLAVKGMPCGIKVGQCKQGIVIGCDSSQINCFAKYSRVPTSQSWYVCSTDAVCPIDELCNGLDDDCDGTLAGTQMSNPAPSQIPANDEIDHDGDGYMFCTTCAGLTLSSTVTGCSDCDDTTKVRHPNAMEVCDGIDNSCDPNWALSPTGSDGKDECTGGTTCCSSLSSCKNLSTDKQNCGSCSNACDPKKSSLCDPVLHCACSKIAQCSMYQYCDPTGNGTCHPCDGSGTNKYCGDSCSPCGTGQKCQTGATASGYTCGCTDDSGCTPAQPYCDTSNGACVAKAPDGHVCGGATGVSCKNACTDGYCCNIACTGVGFNCSACNVSGKEGTCSPVTGNSPTGSVGRTCTNLNVLPCGGTCNNSADCIYTTMNCTPSKSCSGNTLQGQSVCGGGSCSNPGTSTCPGNVQCKADMSDCRPTTCTGDGDCISGYFCNSSAVCQLQKTVNGSCQLNGSGMNSDCLGSGNCAECGTGLVCKVSQHMCKLGQGGSCAGHPGSDCTTGFCVGNTCCNEACNEGCAGSCSTGTCAPASNGTTCTDNALAKCDGSGLTCPLSCAVAGCTNGNCCNTSNVCAAQNMGSGCGAGCAICNATSATPVCMNPGSGYQCGCSADSDCATSLSGPHCDTGTHQCRACALGDSCLAGAGCVSFCTGTMGRFCNAGNVCAACSTNAKCGQSCTKCTGTTTPVCVGGTSGSCQCTADADCAPGQYCQNGTTPTCVSQFANGANCSTANCLVAGCNACSFGDTGSAGSGSACQGTQCKCNADSQCSGGTHNYCTAANLCTDCLGNGNDTHCTNNCTDCTASKQYCKTGGTCAVPSPAPGPCPGDCLNGNNCLQCIKAGTQETCNTTCQ
jgi:hypothetical protein